MKIKKNNYLLIAAVAILACGFAALMILPENEAKLAPQKAKAEVVLEKFYEAMKVGDFETAFELCDTTSMQDYLEAYRSRWKKQSQKDSADFAAITSVLSQMTVSIDEVREQDGMCFISYTLAMDEMTKQCTATAKKEEGEWKVAAITNRI